MGYGGADGVKMPQLPQPKLEFIQFAGGFDTETPRWEVKPGQLRETQNFEIGINGGYIDIEGYERTDGQAAPSAASYSILNVTITGSFAAGDEITQQVSGATATVVLVVTSDDQDYLVITKITGTFDDTNDLEVSASVEGTATSEAMPSGASTPQLDAYYKGLAADEYRNDITAVPGSGSILGVVYYNDVRYAFRNNVGGTAAAMYKSTSSGWSLVALGRELEFTSGGTTEIEEGDTIEGATSGATAVVTRVVLESGSWSGGDAAGRLIFASQTGTFQSENLDVGASTNIATIAGDSSAITLSPSGRYEFDIKNFGGQIGTKRVYGCDRVNRGFEFDGTVFVPIDTGMTNDAPTHVKVHKNHLFFSFGGSAQHSGTGTPYIWSPVFGAAEIATGDDITGFMIEPGTQGGSTLGIYNRNTVHMLYGSSSADWELVRFRDEVGAYAHTLQQFGITLFLDDRGITNLATAQEYGNFIHATLSKHIQSFINTKKTTVVASCISRNKSQYRVFFSDGSGLYITTDGRKIVGMMPILFENPVTCVWSSEDNAGNERIFFGSTNGMVYEMDAGTSFDGEDKEAFMVFHYNFSGSLRLLKKYMEITLETYGTGYSEFSFSYELGYASTLIPQPGAETKTLEFSPVYWDAFVWDQFVWDGVSLSPTTLKLSGSAENISMTIRKNSNYFATNQFNGAFLKYLPRRMLRS